MSPAAAAFASACSAPGPLAAVLAGACGTVVVTCVVACAVAAVWVEPPHPATTAASPTTAKVRTIRMLPVSRRPPEARLNASLLGCARGAPPLQAHRCNCSDHERSDDRDCEQIK